VARPLVLISLRRDLPLKSQELALSIEDQFLLVSSEDSMTEETSPLLWSMDPRTKSTGKLRFNN